MVRTIVIIQARTGSTRLPGKVLMPLAGRPLLERMLERVRAASTPSEIIVATTVDPADDPVRELCGRLGVHCFSGDRLDLLDRHYRAAVEAAADVVVKIPSDCPLIDPAVIDLVIGEYLRGDGSYHFVSNLHPPTWPDGQDVEAMGMNVLETAWREADRDFEREHTTPFIWERPERFVIGNVVWDSGRDLSKSHRWTIDYPEDYRFLAEVYDALASDGPALFSVDDVLALLDARPEIAAINAEHVGINWYRHHRGELKTV